VCSLAVSFFLSFGNVRCKILILLLRSFAVFVQGGISIVIFSQLGFCRFASFSRDMVFGLCAFEFVVVGMGRFEVGCLLCRHSLGSH
jgi:hypothetical protein